MISNNFYLLTVGRNRRFQKLLNKTKIHKLRVDRINFDLDLNGTSATIYMLMYFFFQYVFY